MSEPIAPRRRPCWVGPTALLLTPLVLAGLVLAQGAWFRRTTCETFDEFTYLQLGVRIYRHDDFKCLASPMCPPLPILLEYWLPALRARFVVGTEGWIGQVPELTAQARFLTTATLGVPLVLLVSGWLARRRGWPAGALGGGLLALSPSILAAASVATTDACFAFFGVVATLCLRLYQTRPTWPRLLLVPVGIGLALGSKQTAAIFFPVALVEILLRIPPKRPHWTRVDFGLWAVLWVGLRLAAVVAVAFGVDWACYGFRFAPPFGVAGVYSTLPIVIPMVLAFFANGDTILDSIRQLGPPLAIDGFVGQMQHARQGHPAFFMGARSMGGWWSFFPVAIGIKSTPSELVVLALAVALMLRPATWRDPARRAWLLSAVTLLAAGMASSINIGHRYMLLIYPLATLAAVDWIGEKWDRRQAWAWTVAVALLAGQAVSVAGVMPHYFGYFNFLVGGPTQGHRYLVDSSLDWGQDLPSLRRELEARHYRSVALFYFGTANAAAQGLRTTHFFAPDEEAAARCDWLAVSATSLMSAYGSSVPLYDRFKDLPSTQVGYSIFLYDLADPAVRRAWDSFRRDVAVPRAAGAQASPRPGPPGASAPSP